MPADITNEMFLVELVASNQAIAELLDGVTDEKANFKPAPDKWSILEVIEHLNITDKSSYIAMLRTAEPPTAAELEEKERKFIEMSNMQLIAPTAATPVGKFTTQAEALKVFYGTRKRIEDFAMESDLQLLATGFEHPRLGFLTRSQWLRFLAWHARHHAKQIGRILEM